MLLEKIKNIKLFNKSEFEKEEIEQYLVLLEQIKHSKQYQELEKAEKELKDIKAFAKEAEQKINKFILTKKIVTDFNTISAPKTELKLNEAKLIADFNTFTKEEQDKIFIVETKIKVNKKLEIEELLKVKKYNDEVIVPSKITFKRKKIEEKAGK